MGGAGYSAQGGSAGPSAANLSTNSSFSVGGNAGIGSSSGGLDIKTMAIIGLAVIAVSVIWTRSKK